MKNLDEGRQCDECLASDFTMIEKQGELICKNCGLVVDRSNIDRGPEWRTFNSSNYQNKSRVGSPITRTLHDKGLTTEIGWRNTDASGQMIATNKKKRMNRLRTWQERIRIKDASERNLQFALTELNRMTSALGLPNSVCEVASVIYRRALNSDLICGRSIEGVATSCLYAACRQEGIPRSLNEVAEVARVRRKEIGRTYRYISNELNLELEPVDPKKYLPRFCSELEASQSVKLKAKEIIEFSLDNGLISGKSPIGYAAAAIYSASILCDEKHTQESIADIAQVATATVQKRYREQLTAMGYTDYLR